MSNFRTLVGARNALDALFGAADIVGRRELIVGADGSATPAAQAAMRELAMHNATGLVDLEPTKSRRYPLGFPSTTVVATLTAVTSAQPQIPFRGERLIIPSDFAGSLLINDIKVGKNSQLAAANPLPARAYTEFGWGTDMHLDTADISQFVTLNLENTSAHNVHFNGLILGRAVE